VIRIKKASMSRDHDEADLFLPLSRRMSDHADAPDFA
jgi:hypothetical protein